MHSLSYFSGVRNDIEPLLPPKISRCLEIGCGVGGTCSWLKEKYGCQTYGVELSPKAAAEARKVMDHVIVGDIESLSFGDERFDCILCLDVLEHLADPAATVQKLSRLLTPDGVFIASLPNIQHFSTSLNLLRGSWEYADSGMLDRTHRVFFVRKSAVELIELNGLRLTQLKASIGRRSRILNALTFGAFRGLLSHHYLLKGVPNGSKEQTSTN